MNKLTIICLLLFNILFIPFIAFAQEDAEEIPLDNLLKANVESALKYEDRSSQAAAKYEQAIGESPAAVTIITAEDIQRYGYRTLEEVFATVRGFYISDDRNYGYLGARGFGRPTDFSNRALFLLNGETLNEKLYGYAQISTSADVDLDDVERIEIIRGPGSALYGNSAMFAVVNIITKKGRAIDGFRLSATTGSYGKLQGKGVFGKEFGNGLDVFTSGLYNDTKGQEKLYYKEYDSPDTNNGIAENLDWDKYYRLLANASYKGFSFQGIIKSREKGIPTGSWGTLFNNEKSHTLDEHEFAELKYNKDISADKNISLRGYIHHCLYYGIYPYREYDYFDESHNSWFGFETRFMWDVIPNNRIVSGLEYQNHFQADYRYWNYDYTICEIDLPQSIFSVYIQDECQIAENLSLTFGIRTDRYTEIGNSTNPRFAIVYNPFTSSNLKLLYGHAFRVPSVYETGFQQEGYWLLNPHLKPEKIRTEEIVWEQRLTDSLYSTISMYRYDMKDLIDAVSVSENQNEPLSQYQNINKVKATGVEGELNFRFKSGFNGYSNYTFQNAKDADSGKKLTNSPTHIIRLGLVSPNLKYIFIAGEFQYETERITVYNTKTKPYLLANINISTRWLLNHLRCSFLIRNLFNRDYSFPGGVEHLQPAIQQDGRNYTFKLEYRF